MNTHRHAQPPKHTQDEVIFDRVGTYPNFLTCMCEARSWLEVVCPVDSCCLEDSPCSHLRKFPRMWAGATGGRPCLSPYFQRLLCVWVLSQLFLRYCGEEGSWSDDCSETVLGGKWNLLAVFHLLSKLSSIILRKLHAHLCLLTFLLLCVSSFKNLFVL